jgi:hypothetical protein
MVKRWEIIIAQRKEKSKVGYFLLSNGILTLALENSSGVTFRNVVGRGRLGLNFGVNIGKAECEASCVSWILGTNSKFYLGPRRTTALHVHKKRKKK